MKDILVILAHSKAIISKTELVYTLEKDNFRGLSRQHIATNYSSLRLFQNESLRVSYLRTFSKLLKLGLIQKVKVPNTYDDYYELTNEGNVIAQKIKDNILKESERLSQLIIDAQKPDTNQTYKKDINIGFNRHQKDFKYCFESKCPHARYLYEKLYGT